MRQHPPASADFRLPPSRTPCAAARPPAAPRHCPLPPSRSPRVAARALLPRVTIARSCPSTCARLPSRPLCSGSAPRPPTKGRREMLKRFLITPGPTPVPPEVLLAGAEPIVHHRAPRFVEIFNEIVEGLKYVYQTSNDIIVFAASGTGAMEAAVVNVVNPGDTVIVASVGNFGERWVKLAGKWGAEVVALDFEWGTKADPADDRQGPGRPPRGQGRLRAVQRDLHRRRQRHQGDRRDRRQDPGHPGGRRHQRPRRDRPADRRVAGRRLRGRLAEGAHDAARPGLAAVSEKAWKVVEASARRRASTSTGSPCARRDRRPAQTPYTPAVLAAWSRRTRPSR